MSELKKSDFKPLNEAKGTWTTIKNGKRIVLSSDEYKKPK